MDEHGFYGGIYDFTIMFPKAEKKNGVVIYDRVEDFKINLHGNRFLKSHGIVDYIEDTVMQVLNDFSELLSGYINDIVPETVNPYDCVLIDYYKHLFLIHDCYNAYIVMADNAGAAMEEFADYVYEKKYTGYYFTGVIDEYDDIEFHDLVDGSHGNTIDVTNLYIINLDY
jgi:hypothetical protein